MTDAKQHEWLWHDEESGLTSYGRWAKHPRQAKYIRADLPASVTVKPLEWEQISTCVWRAETQLGYFAEVKCHRNVPDNFYVSSQVIDYIYAEDQPDLQSAMDLAQADCEHRIRLHINITPAPVADHPLHKYTPLPNGDCSICENEKQYCAAYAAIPVAEPVAEAAQDGVALWPKWKAFIWTGDEYQTHDPVWFVDFLKRSKAYVKEDDDGIYISGLPGTVRPGGVIVYQGVNSGMDHGISFHSPISFDVVFGKGSYAALHTLSHQG